MAYKIKFVPVWKQENILWDKLFHHTVVRWKALPHPPPLSCEGWDAPCYFSLLWGGGQCTITRLVLSDGSVYRKEMCYLEVIINSCVT